MLALRKVSLGSPVFISSSVMVARLREGCMGQQATVNESNCTEQELGLKLDPEDSILPVAHVYLYLDE